eukprot:scaffold193_cov255-Pinguiococcus_pyrenoidosus.AAC.24
MEADRRLGTDTRHRWQIAPPGWRRDTQRVEIRIQLRVRHGGRWLGGRLRPFWAIHRVGRRLT